MIRTRWYFSRSFHNPGHANVSGVFKYITARQGQWTGRIPSEITGIDFVAVTYDTDVIPARVVNEDFAALKAAPDIINPAIVLSTTFGEWTNRETVKAALEIRLVDTAHSNLSTVRGFLTRTARQFMVQQYSGRFNLGRPLDEEFGDLPLPVKEQYADFMKAQGQLNNRLPTDTTKWRRIYWDLIQNPPVNWEQAITDLPKAHFGHREARLENNNND